MKVLVLGASGATGKSVVKYLLENKIVVKAVVRGNSPYIKKVEGNSGVEIVKGNINEFTVSELESLQNDCQAVVCCLGHNVTAKGLFGKPRNLVYDAVKGICNVAKTSRKTGLKFILMSTIAYKNKKNNEKADFAESLILKTMEYVLPPHRDNMKAGDYLVNEIGKNEEKIKWVAVRPDGLINKEDEEYELYAQPQSSLFKPRQTSREQVACFMKDLLTDEKLWESWKYKTPVIYNKL